MGVIVASRSASWARSAGLAVAGGGEASACGWGSRQGVGRVYQVRSGRNFAVLRPIAGSGQPGGHARCLSPPHSRRLTGSRPGSHSSGEQRGGEGCPLPSRPSAVALDSTALDGGPVQIGAGMFLALACTSTHGASGRRTPGPRAGSRRRPRSLVESGGPRRPIPEFLSFLSTGR